LHPLQHAGLSRRTPVGRQTGTCIRWLESGREPPLLWVTFTARVLIL
jgi:hypothetical protein